jgi:hypothetical protein
VCNGSIAYICPQLSAVCACRYGDGSNEDEKLKLKHRQGMWKSHYLPVATGTSRARPGVPPPEPGAPYHEHVNTGMGARAPRQPRRDAAEPKEVTFLRSLQKVERLAEYVLGCCLHNRVHGLTQYAATQEAARRPGRFLGCTEAACQNQV